LPKRLEFSIGGTKLSVEFNNADHLRKELNDIDEIKKVIEEKLTGVITTKRQVSPDLSDIGEYVGDYIQLRRNPKEKINKAILTVYLYGPAGATLDEILHTSGIQNPSKNIINSGGNSKYFVSLGEGIYGLSPDGNDTAIKVIADLRKNNKEVEQEGEDIT
jgi:hypothetical protein